MRTRAALLTALLVVGLGAGPAEAKPKSPKKHAVKKPKAVKSKTAVEETTTSTTAPQGPARVTLGMVRQQGCDGADWDTGDTCFWVSAVLADDDPAVSVPLADLLARFTYELKPGGPVPGEWTAVEIAAQLWVDDAWTAPTVLTHTPESVWVRYPKTWERGSGEVTFDGVHRD